MGHFFLPDYQMQSSSHLSPARAGCAGRPAISPRNGHDTSTFRVIPSAVVAEVQLRLRGANQHPAGRQEQAKKAQIWLVQQGYGSAPARALVRLCLLTVAA